MGENTMKTKGFGSKSALRVISFWSILGSRMETFRRPFWASGPGSEAWDLAQNRRRMFFFSQPAGRQTPHVFFRSLGRPADAACYFFRGEKSCGVRSMIFRTAKNHAAYAA